MTWQQSLREAAYNSPSGQRMVFDYENVKKSTALNKVAFEFPDVEGTYIQDLGRSGRKFPMRLILWGEQDGVGHDIAANLLEEMLLEPGTGKLEHPMYGVFDVVPFGAINRRDDLVTAANQTIIEVTFWETIGEIYPTTQTDPGSSLITAIEEYNAAASEEFEEMTDLDSTLNQADLKGSYQALVDLAKGTLEKIAAKQVDVLIKFNSINQSINQSIDLLIGEPLILAAQTLALLQAPAKAAGAINDKLSAYDSMLTTLITGLKAVAEQGLTPVNSNIFHSKNLSASTYLTGSALSVLNNQFQTKTEALEAAEFILDQMDRLTVWRDANFASLAEIDTGAGYQQLLEAVALTTGFLVQLSFTLKQEKRFFLVRPRNMIELVFELYGSIDDQLDFFIDSNELTGSEILEIPAGREIVYYV